MNSEFEKSFFDKKRSLSRFHAQELLLAYAEDQLDTQRKEALERYLPKCKDTQAELKALKAGLEFTTYLRDIELSPEIISEVVSAKVGWGRVVNHLSWSQWPELARWSVEAVLVGVVIAAFASILPMKKIVQLMPGPAKEITLAEAKNEVKVETVSVEVPVKIPASESPTPQVVKPMPSPVQAPKPAAPVATAESADEADPQADATEVSAAARANKASNEKGPKGFVYRAFLSASQIDTMTDEVKKLVLGLGGEKAGSVDLGWRKARGTYFHFSLPESNYEQLITGLKAIGPVRIYKDAHWRVMPEGEIRLILFVEDLALKK